MASDTSPLSSALGMSPFLGYDAWVVAVGNIVSTCYLSWGIFDSGI